MSDNPSKRKTLWENILRISITILTAIATTLGLGACKGYWQPDEAYRPQQTATQPSNATCHQSYHLYG